MADAGGLVEPLGQNGDELQSPLSSLQDVLDSKPATEPAEQSPEMQEMWSLGLDNSEADAEALAKDETIASEDLSTSEGANSSPPPTTTPNLPPDLVSAEEDTKEEEVEEDGKPEERQEEAEEETMIEERQEETEEEPKIEEEPEEVGPEEETKAEEKKEKAEEVGRSEGLKEEVGKSEAKKENEWLDVLGSGQLLKKTLRAGEGVSTRPTPQCQVKMKVKGTLPSGASIDRSNSLSFIVGDGDVIQAIDITASLMEKGEVCSVKADPRFAYGSTGRSPDIPPNTSVMYELELLDVKEPLDLSSISLKDLLAQLNKKRGRGNDLFQRKEFDLAVNSYSRAVQLMRTYREEHINELSGELRDLWIRCLNNLAAAQLKVEQYSEALESVEAVLTTEPENVKALYRCGKVHLIKGDLDLAVEFLSKAANLSTEKAIHTELQKAMRKRDQHREQEKAMYRRMMEGVAQQPKQAAGRGASKSTVTKPSQTNWGWSRLLLGAGIAAVVAAGIAWLTYRYRKIPN